MTERDGEAYSLLEVLLNKIFRRHHDIYMGSRHELQTGVSACSVAVPSVGENNYLCCGVRA